LREAAAAIQLFGIPTSNPDRRRPHKGLSGIR
jgi:hypothetical protein